LNSNAALSAYSAPDVSTAPWLSERINVLGVAVTATNLRSTVEVGAGWIARRERRRIHFCNVHTVMEARKSQTLRRALNSSDLAAPDGMPLVWLAHRAGYEASGRVYGPDFMLAMCEFGIGRGWRHFFFGGRPGVAERLAERLRLQVVGLEVAGTYGPPFRPSGVCESPEVLRRINASDADIIWVGLGTPKQDLWLAQHRPLLRAPLLVAVGAAFDFHVGAIPQAPRWMQSRGLEWLFRFRQEPRRLWYRYLVHNPLFLASLALQQVAPERYPWD
jgi:N-acetylglucosaminyldiphosphoundecaprenol N-acetyl-beta-D-mannosaminyltransferase